MALKVLPAAMAHDVSGGAYMAGCAMYATAGTHANGIGAECSRMSSVPQQRHFYGLNQLHYITSSTYRRARLFESERFKRQFVTTWQDLREELSFRIIGYS